MAWTSTSYLDHRGMSAPSVCAAEKISNGQTSVSAAENSLPFSSSVCSWGADAQWQMGWCLNERVTNNSSELSEWTASCRLRWSSGSCGSCSRQLKTKSLSPQKAPQNESFTPPATKLSDSASALKAKVGESFWNMHKGRYFKVERLFCKALKII